MTTATLFSWLELFKKQLGGRAPYRPSGSNRGTRGVCGVDRGPSSILRFGGPLADIVSFTNLLTYLLIPLWDCPSPPKFKIFLILNRRIFIDC